MPSSDDIKPNESPATLQQPTTMYKTDDVENDNKDIVETMDADDAKTVVQCPNCDLRFGSEDQLQSHVFECHPGLLPEADEEEDCAILLTKGADEQDPGKKVGSKPRNLKCRHCSFKAKNKLEFWEHGTMHIKPEKMLNCPKCSFVTEYKHHLEYHLRNHFGSKPFKCGKCSYSCVNKSMLNSHMKSHSTVYQYRCLDCSYATKYCHSLKLHLRKYAHKPAVVLNPDGTPNPLPIIDVYGTRRGPRPKKPKPDSQVMVPPLQQVLPPPAPPHQYVRSPQTLPPFYISPTVFGSMPQLSHIASPIRPGDPDEKASPCPGVIRCNNCDFQTVDREHFSTHMVQHIANERQEEDDRRKRLISQSDGTDSPVPPTNPIFAPLDLTVANDIEKTVSPPRVEEFRKVPPDFNGYFRHTYASSLGGTTTDIETSSTPSMSPDDVTNSLQRSPPPLHPLSETLANFIVRRRASVERNQRLSEVFVGLSEHALPPYRGHQQLQPRHMSQSDRPGRAKTRWREVHTCVYCNMAFENYSMYTMHMGYHGYANPFKCNICGHQSDDKVSFFLHIARIAHL